MKKIILPGIFCFIVSSFSFNNIQHDLFVKCSSEINYGAQKIVQVTFPDLTGQIFPDTSKQTDLSCQQILSGISSQEYYIAQDAASGHYGSVNRKSNLRFSYNNTGFTVSSRIETAVPEPEWKIEFNRLSLNGKEILLPEDSFITDKNKASIENALIRINYLNDEKGMRQDFIIKNKINDENKIRIDMKVNSSLKTNVSKDELTFSDNFGNEIMKYTSLNVFDAEGKKLHAYFEEDKIKSKRNSQKYFCIAVNAENAVYPVTVDPLSVSANWTAESNQASALMGYKTATAGDVNGDGYSDVIVSAFNFDNGETDEGKVFVYYGSATGLPATASWTAESNIAGARLGTDISTAGDVNGDGYSDIIIAASRYSNPQTDEGKVFVYFGSASGLSANPNWTAEGNQTGAAFGFSVSTAGDITNDGYSDIIIGSYLFDNGQTNEGRAFVYYGSASGLSASANWTYENNSADSWLGTKVAFAGDVNGDNYSDVMIAADNFTNGQFYEGKVYVFHGGSAGLPASPNWNVEGNQASARYGSSVSTAGDVNGDGYSDIIVGASSFDNGQTDEGKVFNYYGTSAGLFTTPSWTFESNQASAGLGVSCSSAGDVNGDGYSDVIIGADLYNNDLTDEGYAVVFTGSSGGLFTFTPYWQNEGNQASSGYGISVATAGDVNGDGFSDVLVGAYLYDNGSTDEGRTFCYYGGTTTLSQNAGWQKESGQNNATWGFGAAAGDVNGDGYSDVIVSSPDFDIGSSVYGIAYTYYGSSGGVSDLPGWTFNAFGDLRPGEIINIGDVNGDGYTDMLIAIRDEYYIHGFELMVGSSSGLINSFPDPGFFWDASYSNHYSISKAGDVNGDGYSDFIVGLPQYTEQAVLIYGTYNFDLNAPKHKTVIPPGFTNNFGKTVGTAGDVNGDGYGDVLVAADNIVFCYHGSQHGIKTDPDWFVTGGNINWEFGYSVGTAGDMNSDGFSDVLIGAPGYSGGQNGEGKVFLYYGSSAGLQTTPGWSYESNITDARIGYDVAPAGDPNGDGYSDFLVSGGRHFYDPVSIDTGRTYLFNSSLTSSWLQLNPPYDLRNIAGGDFNADGYSDILMGIPRYTNGQSSEGASKVFYGNGVTGLSSVVSQLKPSSSDQIPEQGFSGVNGSIRFEMPGKNFIGRSKGKIVYEYKLSGTPFSGINIHNSTASSGEGNFTDLMLTGSDLVKDIAGLSTAKEYKWRARVKYDLMKSPFQKFGPWRYFSGRNPNPYGSFKAQNNPLTKQLNLKCIIQGFYNSSSNTVIPDTLTVSVLKQNPLYGFSKKVVTDVNGNVTIDFPNALNNLGYYIRIIHRNSITTWSSLKGSFTNSQLNYDFSSDSAKALGNNMLLIDSLPVVFGIYGGDVDRNGIVDLSDITSVYNAAALFVTGYVVNDVTGDNYVDLSDLTLTFNNSITFVSVIEP